LRHKLSVSVTRWVFRFEFRLVPGQGNSPLFGDWPFGPCVRGLVVGHYQPLADNPRVARGLDQTSSPQSVQRTLEKPSSVLPLKSLSGELRILTPEKPKAAPLRRQLSDPASRVIAIVGAHSGHPPGER